MTNYWTGGNLRSVYGEEGHKISSCYDMEERMLEWRSELEWELGGPEEAYDLDYKNHVSEEEWEADVESWNASRAEETSDERATRDAEIEGALDAIREFRGMLDEMKKQYYERSIKQRQETARRNRGRYYG